MQFAQTKPPVGVVFDSDLGNGIDDVLALAVLFGISGKGESRVIGVSVTKPSLKAAAFCDALVRFFTAVGQEEPGRGGIGAFGQNGLPVGLTLGSKNKEDTPMMDAVLKSFSTTVREMNDTADPVAAMRNTLSAQYEKNGIVYVGGPATNLAGMLALPGGKAFVQDKVRQLLVVLGSFPQGAADPAIAADIPAARKMFAEWPTPVIAVGAEVGEAVPFLGASIETAFTWATPTHPLVEAYKAYRKMPYDAPTAGAAGVLQVLRPQENYFKLSEPGTISVLDDGRTRFTPSAGGKHQYLIVDPAQKERVQQAYVELASMKPVPRATRFRPPQKKQ